MNFESKTKLLYCQKISALEFLFTIEGEISTIKTYSDASIGDEFLLILKVFIVEIWTFTGNAMLPVIILLGFDILDIFVVMLVDKELN